VSLPLRVPVASVEHGVVHGTGSTARDITQAFTEAAKGKLHPRHLYQILVAKIRLALPVGVLIKDEAFTLFESVGALEVRSYGGASVKKDMPLTTRI
jgi:hypothetical protein